jgi:hypothetical protein
MAAETKSNNRSNLMSNNYIVRLKEENKLYRQQVLGFEDKLQDFLIYLASSKFQGFDNNYVNVDEVRMFLVNLRDDMRYTLATI